MQIKNGFVFDNERGFIKRDICIAGDVIANCGDGCDCINADGLYVIPGLTDIHFHGCAGLDFCDGTAVSLQRIAEHQLQNGVTQLCPATMALPMDKLYNVMVNYSEFNSGSLDYACSQYVGVNIEGCFISSSKCGAHSAEYIQELDISLFERLNSACGNAIRLVTVAPERDGGIDFISALATRNIRVGIGHTAADYAAASKAFSSGASQVTHLFNAMPPFLHRATGVIGAAFDNKSVMAELICDGVHIAPAAIRAAIALFGDSRIIMISDSMRAAGLKDGDYTLGNNTVTKHGKEVRMKDGALAGSALTLLDCLRATVNMGVPLESAIRMTAVNPVRSIGLMHKYGSLDVGKYANIALLSANLELVAVINRGKTVFAKCM